MALGGIAGLGQPCPAGYGRAAGRSCGLTTTWVLAYAVGAASWEMAVASGQGGGEDTVMRGAGPDSRGEAPVNIG